MIFLLYFCVLSVSISDHVLPLNVRTLESRRGLGSRARAHARAAGGRGRDHPGRTPAPPGGAPRPRPTGLGRRGGARSPSPAQAWSARWVPDSPRREGGRERTVGAVRQARGPGPAGVGDPVSAGTEPELGRRPKLFPSARPGEAVPEWESVAFALGVSLSRCSPGGRVAPVWRWEPSSGWWAPASGPGSVGVASPSFWRVRRRACPPYEPPEWPVARGMRLSGPSAGGRGRGAAGEPGASLGVDR